MRLTADVIVHARASINPCDERELDLRGYKIPMIENIGVTQDQFDAMDFSDNEIKKLDNFPRYKRLSSLLLCNNHVSKIATDLGAQLPNLTCLILTNNKVATLGDLQGLASCKKLTMLSLMHNEVVNKQYYRLYTIDLVPSLKDLDFQKVTVKERESASRLARSQAGQAMMQDVAQEVKKAKTFTPGKPAAAEEKLTDRHRAIYAERIAKATTVEEIEMLTRKIKAGIVPSATYKQGGDVAVANGAAPAAADAPAKPPADGAAMETDGDAEAEAKGDDEPSSATSNQSTGNSSKASSGPPAMPPPATPSAPAAAGAGTSPAPAEGQGASDADEEDLQDAPAPAAVAGAMVATTAVAAAAASLPAGASSMDVQEGGGEAVTVTAGGGSGNGSGGVVAAPEGIASSAGDGDAMVEGEEIEGERGQEGDAAAAVDAAEAAMAAAEEGGRAEQEEGGAAVAADGAGDMDQEAKDAGDSKLSESEIKKFKVADLKKYLVYLSLPTNGLKADLQARLLEAMGF